jgi:hypothetical protein
MVLTSRFGRTRRSITPKGSTILTKVSELIDPYTGAWDKEQVNDVFWEEDVQHILAIPIRQGAADTLAWHFDKKGMFSVKSAYHVMEDQREGEQRRDHGESSAALAKDASLPWPSLWKFQCQPKIKQFLWRLAHNSLPLRSNIKRRGVEDVDTRCPVCKRLDEDRGHCFLKCKSVKKCWQALNLEQVRLRLLSLSSSRDVVQYVLDLKGEERVLVPCFLWTWWDARNKANAGEGMLSKEEVHHRAMTKLLQRLHPRQGSNSGQRQCSWQPPKVMS